MYFLIIADSVEVANQVRDIIRRNLNKDCSPTITGQSDVHVSGEVSADVSKFRKFLTDAGLRAWTYKLFICNSVNAPVVNVTTVGLWERVTESITHPSIDGDYTDAEVACIKNWCGAIRSSNRQHTFW